MKYLKSIALLLIVLLLGTLTLASTFEPISDIYTHSIVVEQAYHDADGNLIAVLRNDSQNASNAKIFFWKPRNDIRMYQLSEKALKPLSTKFPEMTSSKIKALQTAIRGGFFQLKVSRDNASIDDISRHPTLVEAQRAQEQFLNSIQNWPENIRAKIEVAPKGYFYGLQPSLGEGYSLEIKIANDENKLPDGYDFPRKINDVRVDLRVVPRAASCESVFQKFMLF